MTMCGLSLSLCTPPINNDAALAALLAEATLPTRDGILTSTSTTTVDPDYGTVVPVNTPNGRTVNVGPFSFIGAALLAQGASTGLYGALTTSSGLVTNTPSGTPTIRRIVEDSANSRHAASEIIGATLTNAVNYSISFYVKKVGAANRWYSAYLAAGANRAGCIIDPVTGSVTPYTVGNGTFVRGSARLIVGGTWNGYWLAQCVVSSVAWGAVALLNVQINDTAAGDTTYLGNGVSGIDISGYDVTQGDFARTPLAWDGSLGVSRVANLLQWNQGLDTTAGTIIAQVMTWGRSGSISSPLPRIYSGTSTGQMYYVESGPRIECQRHDAVASSRVVSTGNSFPAVAGQQEAFTQRWDAASNRITSAGVTNSSGTPTLPYAAATPIMIGNILGLANPFDGHVFIAKWNRALTDAEVALWVANTQIIVP